MKELFLYVKETDVILRRVVKILGLAIRIWNPESPNFWSILESVSGIRFLIADSDS